MADNRDVVHDLLNLYRKWPCLPWLIILLFFNYVLLLVITMLIVFNTINAAIKKFKTIRKN
jgi:hypothetical protein